jgi:Domain of unknown function (DUF4349)
VAGENAVLSAARPGRAAVTVVLKVPDPAYPATLAALGRLGTTVAERQQATDVTQAVADVASRAASARAAIARLRALLAHAGSVSSLLSVQEQINGQEASLEELQAQQRALARETAYATISLVVRAAPAPAGRHRRPPAPGFAGGLSAGWRALRVAVSWLLTAAGAVLPFAVPVALAVAGGFRARRWRAHRRAGPRPAG